MWQRFHQAILFTRPIPTSCDSKFTITTLGYCLLERFNLGSVASDVRDPAEVEKVGYMTTRQDSGYPFSAGT